MDTIVVLLSVVCVSGALAQCHHPDPGLFITAPKTMEALSGSCLMIPCSFRTKETFVSTRTTYGVWMKSGYDFGPKPNHVIYNSSGTVNIHPMDVTGDLSQRNCSTMLYDLNTTHSDKYYFRIENRPVMATAVCDPLQINVTDALVPTITIPADLREQQAVTITCSAFTPCPHFPPKLTWSLQPEPHNHTEENTDGTFTTRIQETITLSEQHDGLDVSCSASYPVAGGVKAAQTVVTLSVSYGPKDTSASISPPGLVSAGSWVNLTCSSRAKPPVSSFTWFQISTDGAKAVSEGAFYTFNATRGGVYYCVASNGLRNHTSPRVHLSIGGEHCSDRNNLNRRDLIQLHVSMTTVGVVVGLIVLIAVCWRLSTQRQSETGEDAGVQEDSAAAEADTLHYGDIRFSGLRPEPSGASEQDTVYTQVTTQPGAGSEPLYAQVRTKTVSPSQLSSMFD